MANLGEMWKQKSQSHGSYGKCLDTTRPGEQHRVAPPEVVLSVQNALEWFPAFLFRIQMTCWNDAITVPFLGEYSFNWSVKSPSIGKTMKNPQAGVLPITTFKEESMSHLIKVLMFWRAFITLLPENCLQQHRCDDVSTGNFIIGNKIVLVAPISKISFPNIINACAHWACSKGLIWPQ